MMAESALTPPNRQQVPFEPDRPGQDVLML